MQCQEGQVALTKIKLVNFYKEARNISTVFLTFIRKVKYNPKTLFSIKHKILD